MSIDVGSILEGTISKITGFGAFVQLPDDLTGMVHISEIANDYVKDISEHFNVGDKIKVKVLSVDGQKISLSVKRAVAAPPQPQKKPVYETGFEDLMQRFMKDSDERQTDIKKNARNKRSGGYSRGR